MLKNQTYEDIPTSYPSVGKVKEVKDPNTTKELLALARFYPEEFLSNPIFDTIFLVGNFIMTKKATIEQLFTCFFM